SCSRRSALRGRPGPARPTAPPGAPPHPARAPAPRWRRPRRQRSGRSPPRRPRPQRRSGSPRRSTGSGSAPGAGRSCTRNCSGTARSRPVELVPPGRPLLLYTRAAEGGAGGAGGGGGGDTVSVADWRLVPSAAAVRLGPGAADSATLTFRGARGGARVTLEYRFAAAEYRFAVRGRFEGFGPGGATLLPGVGDGLRLGEGRSPHRFPHLAVGNKGGGTRSTAFQ